MVCGLRSKETQKKLLTAEHTFDAALKVALSAEAAEKDVAAFSQESSASVNKVDSGNHQSFPPTQGHKGPRNRGKFNSSGSNIKDPLECLSCGKTGHPSSQCKYRNYPCHSCGKVGHISEACKGKPQKVHQLEGSEPPQTSPPDDSVDPFSLSLYNLSSGQQGIEIPVKLNRTSLLMELDTGAGVSVISEETYKKHFSGTPLMPSNRLHAYTGHPLKVHGQLIAHLKYQDQSADVPLLVVEGSGPSLFGRDWLSQIRLDWTKICNIRVSETDLPKGVASQLRTTIQNHPNVFKPGLGTVKGITAKLEMKPDAPPKFCKAHPVPYALQEAVEAEYNHLESEGIVERVGFSEWATLMVHVPKVDGTTLSSGDYAITVNPQHYVPQYPWMSS